MATSLTSVLHAYNAQVSYFARNFNNRRGGCSNYSLPISTYGNLLLPPERLMQQARLQLNGSLHFAQLEHRDKNCPPKGF